MGGVLPPLPEVDKPARVDLPVPREPVTFADGHNTFFSVDVFWQTQTWRTPRRPPPASRPRSSFVARRVLSPRAANCTRLNGLSRFVPSGDVRDRDEDEEPLPVELPRDARRLPRLELPREAGLRLRRRRLRLRGTRRVGEVPGPPWASRKPPETQACCGDAAAAKAASMPSKTSAFSPFASREKGSAHRRGRNHRRRRSWAPPAEQSVSRLRS